MNKSKGLTPIFLFSLPRSGSTLVQKVLASHREIATTSEPWVLLPFLSALRPNGVYADYRHYTAVRAIEDFCKCMPNGENDYFGEMRHFVQRLYSQAAGEPVRYFLDKTPRYSLIVDQVIDLFPDGKFIFLWRNPLSVIASMLELFDNGQWELYRFRVDLFVGALNLVTAFGKYRERVCAIRYEEIVAQQKDAWQRLFSYLDLSFDELVLSDFTQTRLDGRLGDPTGIKEYQVISSEPLQKWKHILSNPLRKLWCRRYLVWFGPDRLRMMGYDLDSLLGDLKSVPSAHTHLVSDAWRMIWGVAYSLSEPHILKQKIKRFPFFYSHA